MISKRRINPVIFLLLVAFLLAACGQRPLPTNNGNDEATSTMETAADEETSAMPEEGGEVEETAVNPTEPEPEESTNTGEETGKPTDESEESTGGEPIESDPEEAAAETSEEQINTIPATHTVATGENLYQIGLQYGISWVALAQHNNIPNANQIVVGQVIRIPQGANPVENTPDSDDNLPPADERLFVDISDQAGIASTHDGKWDENLPVPYDNGYLAAGMAWSDYDNDGWVDLFVTGNLDPNVLYHNNQDGTFSVSEYSDMLGLPGLPTGGAVWADYDNDGWRDLYVVNMGANRLFRNLNGNGFEDVTVAGGVGDIGKGSTAAWGDYDKDGHLDLYVTNWSCYPGCETTDFSRSRDVLYRNNGDSTFTDVSGLLLYDKLLGAGFSVSFVDYDNDLDLDLYVVNDKVANPVGNVLWRNDGAGCNGWCWTDVSENSNTNSLVYGMALAVGDYDNDRDLDFYVPNMVSDMVLLENQGDGTFDNVTRDAGVHYATERSVGWGTAFFDFDNDGWLDLYLAATGISPNFGQVGKHFEFPDMLYRNNHDGAFTAVEHALLSGEDHFVTMGMSTADFNNDGWVDYALTIWNEGHRLYLNTGQSDEENNWLSITLVGGNGLPHDPIGTRVVVTTTDGLVQTRELKSGSSLGAGNDLNLHFGLGAATIEQVEVHWLNGEVDSYFDVSENQRCLITSETIECSNP